MVKFYPLENKRATIFAKTLIGKCQISKSRGQGPRSDAHAWGSSCLICTGSKLKFILQVKKTCVRLSISCNKSNVVWAYLLIIVRTND